MIKIIIPAIIGVVLITATVIYFVSGPSKSTEIRIESAATSTVSEATSTQQASSPKITEKKQTQPAQKTEKEMPVIKSAPIVQLAATTTESQPTVSPYAGQITPYLVTPLSPYYKKIRISSVNYAATGGSPTVIKLASNLQKEESVNITGWRLKSNRQEIIIPKAIKDFKIGVAAWLEEYVYLSANHFVNIYSNTSAIGKNLRLNKCIGYLENDYDFTPSIPLSCPSPAKRTEFTHLAGYCQSYLLGLGACKPVDSNYYNSLSGTSDGNACRAFLNTIGTYGNCYNIHYQDTDFFSNEWRMWVNQNILDSQHDRVRLFDKDGQLVDEYYY